MKTWSAEKMHIDDDNNITNADSGMAVSVTGLDKTAKYYLKFTAPSDFKGYVE